MKTILARLFSVGLIAVALSACGVPQETGINDPYEQTNRRIHAFNKGLDRTIVRPVANAYGEAVPQPVKGGIANLGDYLRTPRFILNDVAQGNIDDAGHNFSRLVVNTIFGFAILDPASDMGIEARPTGFGDTLATWGTYEGAFVELPLLGPSTSRDTVGVIVDILTNPVSPSLESSQRAVPPTINTLEVLDTRHRLKSTIDGIYYESADSYAVSRDVYLQNRRFELGADSEELEFDPFAEFQ